jgi:serine/threonine protein kinase
LEYEPLNQKVGEGSFGKVFAAKVKATGKLVVFKIINYDQFGITAETVREIGILKGIDH